MASVERVVLMVEIDSPNAETAAARLSDALPDATVWGEVDGVDAALLIMDRHLTTPVAA